MGQRTAWKKLINDPEAISYEKDLGEYRIIIEARQLEDDWEIVKKYLGSGMNFVETYSADSKQELKNILRSLRSEKDLSRNDIKNISDFKKRNLKILVRRGYKERNVEKWYFSLGENFCNFVTLRYGRDMEMDIVMEEQLKYIEEKIISQLHDTLGLEDMDIGVRQNIYYFTKKNSSYVDKEESDFEMEFLFE